MFRVIVDITNKIMISTCIFSNNVGSFRGSALGIKGSVSKITIYNSTFYQNSASDGSAVYALVTRGQLSINASSMSQNTASGNGGREMHCGNADIRPGAIYVTVSSSASLELSQITFSQNAAYEGKRRIYKAKKSTGGSVYVISNATSVKRNGVSSAISDSGFLSNSAVIGGGVRIIGQVN